MASYEMSNEQLDELVEREEAYRQACEKAAANGTTVVQFSHMPAPPRRKR